MSHLTALTRKRPSSPIRFLFKNNLIQGRVLDYGCGKGFDADYFGFDKFDPYYFHKSLFGLYDCIICSYVLNVVGETEQKKMINRIRNLLAPKGRAYFTVRRDLPKQGRAGRGCFQRYVILKYPKIYENSDYCIYQINK